MNMDWIFNISWTITTTAAFGCYAVFAGILNAQQTAQLGQVNDGLAKFVQSLTLAGITAHSVDWIIQVLTRHGLRVTAVDDQFTELRVVRAWTLTGVFGSGLLLIMAFVVELGILAGVLSTESHTATKLLCYMDLFCVMTCVISTISTAVRPELLRAIRDLLLPR